MTIPTQFRLASMILLSVNLTLSMITPGFAFNSKDLATKDSEYVFGQKWLKSTRIHLDEQQDPYCTDILETLLTRLKNQFKLGHLPLTSLCLNSDEFNAFAAPGGIIGVNRGVYLDLKNEDQLMAILAHELAHLAQRHHYRGLRKSERLSPGKMATLAGIVAAIATQQGQTANSLILGGQAANAQMALAYSRDFEREADRMGLYALRGSGYRLEAMAEVISILADKQSWSDRNLSFLSTHPIGLDRQSDIEARIYQLEQKELRPPLLNELDFYLFRCIQTENLQEIPKGPYEKQCKIMRLALQQFRNKSYEQALSTFSTLNNATKNSLTGLDLTIAFAIRAHRIDMANDAIETLELFFPSWITPIIARLDLASVSGAPLPRQFRFITKRRSDRLDLWKALARYAQQSKQPHLLFEARGWDALLHGKLEAAETAIIRAEENWPKNQPITPLQQLKKEFIRAKSE